MSEHLLHVQCSSCTWEGLEQEDSPVEGATKEKLKEGGNQLLLSLCLCWIPTSASRGQGRYVL